MLKIRGHILDTLLFKDIKNVHFENENREISIQLPFYFVQSHLITQEKHKY